MEMEKIIRIPTVSSWRIVLLLVFLLIVATEISIFGLSSQSTIFFASGATTVIIISIMMTFIPKYAHSQSSPSSITCAVTILLQLVLLYSTLNNSWPAILFWIIAGKFNRLFLLTSPQLIWIYRFLLSLFSKFRNNTLHSLPHLVLHMPRTTTTTTFNSNGHIEYDIGTYTMSTTWLSHTVTNFWTQMTHGFVG